MGTEECTHHILPRYSFWGLIGNVKDTTRFDGPKFLKDISVARVLMQSQILLFTARRFMDVPVCKIGSSVANAWFSARDPGQQDPRYSDLYVAPPRSLFEERGQLFDGTWDSQLPECSLANQREIAGICRLVGWASRSEFSARPIFNTELCGETNLHY